MTKEEILEKHTEQVFFDMKNGDRALRTVVYYEKAMQEYSDQETERLKDELNEVKKQYSELCDIQKKLCEQNINLESELNELKERHKKSVETTYKDAEDFYKKVYTVSSYNWGLKQIFDFADNYANEVLFCKLNELKERHKKDVESAFRDGLYRPKIYKNNAELYYKQKFESNG